MTDQDKIIQAKRAYMKEWRRRNAEHLRAYHKQWRRQNLDKWKAAQERYWLKKAE